MPSPFVYRSLLSIRPGFSVGTLLMSTVFLFSFPASFFLRRCRLFAHFLTTLVSPNCVCYQYLTTDMCNPAYCPHTLCPMKWLVLAYSTIVTFSMSDSDKFTGETPNCQSLTRGTDWGKLLPSSHERGELRYTVIR